MTKTTFRFIHAADLHLDSPLQGLELHEGAPVNLLRGATRRALENLVNLTIEEDVDFLLIAGDIYDGDWKDYSTGLFFRSQMVRLKDQGIPVYLISGNHDAASVISKKLPLPENVHTFSTKKAESREVAGVPAVIHGQGFPNRAVPENLAAEYPPALSGKFNIGLLHTSLNGMKGHDTYAPCSLQDLRAKGYDYWALGHIHQPEVLSTDPWIVFAGNVQGRHIRETGARGCQLVTVNERLQVESAERRILDVVRWAVVEVDLAKVETESEALQCIRASLKDQIERSEGRLAATRVRLTGATPLHGGLHKNSQHWRAQLRALAQDFGEESLWIERMTIDTIPIYDVAQLAERDALTGSVLKSLEQASLARDKLHADILEMLDVLPPDVRSEVERDFEDFQRDQIMGEVRAIILEALKTKGETTT